MCIRDSLETINDEDARVSPYLEVLGARFRLHCDHKRVVYEWVVSRLKPLRFR